MKIHQYIAFGLVGASLCSVALAQSYRPSDSALVLLESRAPSDKVQAHQRPSIEQLRTLLEESARPVNAHRLDEVQRHLNALSAEQQLQSEGLYLKAQVEQREHEFESALITLSQLLALSPSDHNALLMQANILSLTGQYPEAKQACTQAATLGGMDIYVACVSEVLGKQGHSEKAYQLLAPVLEKFSVPETPIQVWMTYLAAEHALDLGRPGETIELLQAFELREMPTSTLLLWVDAQLELNRHERVLEQLESLLKDTVDLDDALLNRLAIAEKVGKGAHWQSLAKTRFRLREARGDTLHMAELARFFLFVEPDAEKALSWASKNWVLHKSSDDRRLLLAAQLVNGGKA